MKICSQSKIKNWFKEKYKKMSNRYHFSNLQLAVQDLSQCQLK